MALIDRKYGIAPDHDDSEEVGNVMNRVMSVCQGLTDAKYSTKSSTRDGAIGGHKVRTICSAR